MNSKRAITRVLGYNMGKAAVDCYNQWFAVEMANRHGDLIRMNAIMPGFFLTEQNTTRLPKELHSLSCKLSEHPYRSCCFHTFDSDFVNHINIV